MPPPALLVGHVHHDFGHRRGVAWCARPCVLIRGAMAALLALESDLTVVAQAATGAQAIAMARAIRPDVAVLDLQMPDIDGISIAWTLHDELPACRTMIVTSHGLPGYLKRALAVGVRGFLPKTVSADILATVVRTVHGGGRYVDPQLAGGDQRRRQPTDGT